MHNEWIILPSPIPCLELLLTAIADSKTFFQSCRKWECINCHIHRECSEGCYWPYIVDCSLSQCVYLGSYHILVTYFNVDNDTPLYTGIRGVGGVQQGPPQTIFLFHLNYKCI